MILEVLGGLASASALFGAGLGLRRWWRKTVIVDDRMGKRDRLFGVKIELDFESEPFLLETNSFKCRYFKMKIPESQWRKSRVLRETAAPIQCRFWFKDMPTVGYLIGSDVRQPLQSDSGYRILTVEVTDPE